MLENLKRPDLKNPAAFCWPGGCSVGALLESDTVSKMNRMRFGWDRWVDFVSLASWARARNRFMLRSKIVGTELVRYVPLCVTMPFLIFVLVLGYLGEQAGACADVVLDFAQRHAQRLHRWADWWKR